MTHPVHKLAVIALAGAVLLFRGAAWAAVSEDPDWPCVQRLMPEISAATVWNGPPINDARRAWRETRPVRDLVVRIADRRMTPEEAERDIAAFVKTLKSEEKNPTLTLLFAGVWETLNDRRRAMIEKIKEFARQQRARAERIEQKLLDFDRISADTSAAGRARTEEFSQDLAMEVRIFEDREKSIRYLCDLPVKVEGTLGALARVISAQLN